MGLNRLQVITHELDGQHIRGRRGGSGDDRVPTKVHVKQYVPISNDWSSNWGDVTVVATTGNGFTKELYEPFFDGLVGKFNHYSAQSHESAARCGNNLGQEVKNSETIIGQTPLRIRSIWIADVSNMGYSSLLNTHNLGNETDYFDHSRDLLHMINHFRSQMPPPVIGIGHSMGTVALAALASFHPRLFAALAFLETVICDLPIPKSAVMRKNIARKPEHWPTRETAETSMRSMPLLKHWDARVVDLFCKHGLTETPNVLFPDRKGWCLTTTKHQEILNTANGAPVRPECMKAFRLLPLLEPPVLFLQGHHSPHTTHEARARRLEIMNVVNTVHGEDNYIATKARGPRSDTSTGKVTEMEIEGGHFLPFENVDGSADAVARFCAEHAHRWVVEERSWLDSWGTKTSRERQDTRKKGCTDGKGPRTIISSSL